MIAMAATGLKCIIIDDDPLITDVVDHYCSKIAAIDYCVTCNNAVDGLKLISTQDFDLVFLDFNMPNLTGKALLELKSDNSKVIMITSESSFAVDSYNYPQIIDYLLKPINFERFEAAVGKYSAKAYQEKPATVAAEKAVLYIKDGKKWIPVKIADIYYIRSESNYVSLHTAAGKVMSLSNMKDLEDELPEQFMRVHRSYIINKNHISYITAEEVAVAGENIPVSTKYRTKVRALVES